MKVLGWSALRARPEIATWALGDTIVHDYLCTLSYYLNSGEYVGINKNGNIVLKNLGYYTEVKPWSKSNNNTQSSKTAAEKFRLKQDKIKESLTVTLKPGNWKEVENKQNYILGSWKES